MSADKYYLLNRIWPLGVSETECHIAEKLIFAIKNNDPQSFEESGFMLIENGMRDWGEHCIKISLGLQKTISNRKTKHREPIRFPSKFMQLLKGIILDAPVYIQM